MKRFFIAAVALALSACTAGLPPPATTPPAPFEETAIDEKALITTFSAYDVALTAVDGLVASGRIVPGSPFALKVKGYLVRALSGLNAAKAARDAGSSGNYLAALDSAQEALTLASAALRKGE